jgi:hypothetical protein
MKWINRRGVRADIVCVMFLQENTLCVYSHANSGAALICFLGGKVYGGAHG